MPVKCVYTILLQLSLRVLFLFLFFFFVFISVSVHFLLFTLYIVFVVLHLCFHFSLVNGQNLLPKQLLLVFALTLYDLYINRQIYRQINKQTYTYYKCIYYCCCQCVTRHSYFVFFCLIHCFCSFSCHAIVYNLFQTKFQSSMLFLLFLYLFFFMAVTFMSKTI